MQLRWVATVLAGAAALVWRNGSVRQIAALGRRDLVSGAPVERDTIFRRAFIKKTEKTPAGEVDLALQRAKELKP